jgi:DNA-binding response OmpR family regulator
MNDATTSMDASTPLRALLCDDASDLRMVLEPLLVREGFEVKVAAEGTVAVDLAATFDPDVVIMDIVLPGLDGLEACRRIRQFSDAYLLILSAKNSEIDKVVGLSIGADDYVTKPFSPNELIARLRALLRRPRRAGRGLAYGNDVAVRTFGPMTVDTAARVVTVDGVEIELTRIEFDLLATLCSRPRQVFSRTQLLEMVWGPNWYGDTHVVDVHMSNLRRKLGDRDRIQPFILTVRGVGFRLSDDVVEHQPVTAH